MNRRLDALSPAMQPKAFELLARCVEAGLAVIVVNTLRTAEEQAACRAAGTSWVKHSLHEDGLAIDIAPLAQYTLHGPNKIQWDAKDPAWAKLGAIGERVGLWWGGRWKEHSDPGHFQLMKGY